MHPAPERYRLSLVAHPIGACDPSWRAEWHIQDVVQAKAINVLYGPPKARKSTFRAHLLAAMMTGQPCAGAWAIGHRVQNALIIMGEEHKDAEAARLAHAFAGVGADVLKHEIQIVPPEGLAFARWRLDDNDCVGSLLLDIETEGFDLVMMDALVYLHGQDENSAGGMGLVMQALTEIKQLATVVVVHHTPKHNPKVMRGSSVIRGAYDLGMCLTRESGDPDAPCVLDVEARYGESRENQALHCVRTPHHGYGSAVEWRHGGEAGLEDVILELFRRDRGDWTVDGMMRTLHKSREAIDAALRRMQQDRLVAATVKDDLIIWRRA